MNTPRSYPANPVQPDQAVFSTEQLQIFQPYTRAGYLLAFGVQAPSFDATRPAQYWFDSTAVGLPANQAMNYLQVQLAPAEIVPLTVPAGQAAAPNIPGLVVYPPYVVAQTTATSGGSLVNPSVLSDYSDALILAAELGLAASSVIAGPALTWNSETRGDWMMVLPGNPNPYYVGTLLLDQYANGIGSPGAWSIRNPGTPNAQALWTPVPPGPDGITTGIPTQTTPVPVRALLPNEVFVPAGMTGGVMLARTDLASPSVLGTVTGFSQQDAVMLAAIDGALFPGNAG
jgi:hypothetical protein